MIHSTGTLGRRRVALLWLLAAAAALGAALLPRLPQDPGYHAFSDARTLGVIPNAADVLSNLGFLAAGLAGLAAVLTGAARFADARERAPWRVFFFSVALVGPGSAWYHLAPSNGSLVWDRLPMAAAFAALLVAALAERVSAAASRLLAPLVVASVATVLYWSASEAAGVGDLRPYAVAQYYPLLAIPLILALFPGRYDRSEPVRESPDRAGRTRREQCKARRPSILRWYVREEQRGDAKRIGRPGDGRGSPYGLSGRWVAGLGLYGVAKLAEAADALLFHSVGVSGHTLKHLLAAAGVGVLAWMVRSRAAGDQRG